MPKKIPNIFHLKIDFYEEKNTYILIRSEYIRYILIDLNKIFPIKLSEFEISHSVESYDEKTEIATLPKSV